MGIEMLPRTIELRNESGEIHLLVVDQRALPQELCFLRITRCSEVVSAIKQLAVRGAPALGIAGAGALLLFVMREMGEVDNQTFAERITNKVDEISRVRPTAVNLRWGLDRVCGHALAVYQETGDLDSTVRKMFDFVKSMEQHDEENNRMIGENGAKLLVPQCRVLTHCNAGSLATVFYGTALGVVYSALGKGGIDRVYVDETRPVNQGARLTIWELSRVGIPTTLICDNMAASVMAAGKVDVVIVGADRVCSNGDVANKIGTYGLALLARHHGIPFYVAAPLSSFDMSLASGNQVVIEQRDPAEVTSICLEGVDVYNPAFDITPACYITAIMTEKGVFQPDALGGLF